LMIGDHCKIIFLNQERPKQGSICRKERNKRCSNYQSLDKGQRFNDQTGILVAFLRRIRIMPPYSESVNGDNEGDVYKAGLQRKDRTIDLGFTTPLIESISTSKAKIETWDGREKYNADLSLESYNKYLVQQQAIIDSQIKELNHIQRERGMTGEILVGKDENDDDCDSVGRKENIASRKKALEDASTKIQMEIMKLETERDNREKRVKGVSLEESKQRIRAGDAADLKRRVEESKNTTIDDLTQGVVNYKKMGMDFQRTGHGMLR